jgi:Arc/MetJ-type ribon-helix-helix transcriptional regulator
MQTKKEIETIPVATRITKPMLKAIQMVLATNAHINIADYVRDLIRRDLEERGVLTEKESESHE